MVRGGGEQAPSPQPRTSAEAAPARRELIGVVEDDADTGEVLATVLERAGYDVVLCRRGEDAVAALPGRAPALILLDLNLPDIDGLEVYRRLRLESGTASVPVVILTARVEEVDRIVGLSLGADDYVTKPFNPRELVLRIRAILRATSRAEGAAPREKIEIASVTLYPDEHILMIGGEELFLTPTECKLLQILMSRAGRVQSRETLIEEAWGGVRNVEPRTLDVHVHRLRRKLGAAAARLETVTGLGYLFRG
jgi:two-component system phosphate regulon response regulator PhoB